MSDEHELPEQPDNVVPLEQRAEPIPQGAPVQAPIQPARPADQAPRRTSQPGAPRPMTTMLIAAGVVLVIGICVVAWLLDRSETKLKRFVLENIPEV